MLWLELSPRYVRSILYRREFIFYPWRRVIWRMPHHFLHNPLHEHTCVAYYAPVQGKYQMVTIICVSHRCAPVIACSMNINISHVNLINIMKKERKKQYSHRHKNEITDCVSDHFSFHRIEWLAILMHALSLSLRLLSNTPHATKYIMRCQMRLLVNGYYRHDWPHLPLKGIMRRRRHRQRRWRWRMSICSAVHTHANARLSATIDTIWSDTRKNKIK